MEQLGIKPKDLNYVVLTHLDSDHIGAVKLLKEAKNIMTSKQEMDAFKNDKLRYKAEFLDGIELKSFSMTKSEYGPQQKSFDLFKDNSIIFVHTPGHSRGLFSTLVQWDEKFVAIIGDVGYAQKSWKELILPGICINKEDALKSLKWVKNLSQQPNCLEILASHDPEIKPHIVEL